MKVLLLVCGRLKEDYLRAAEAEYEKRLRAYCKLEVKEVKDVQALLDAVPPGARLLALDERGDLLTSRGFADVLDDHEQHGGGAQVVFAIGGPEGLSEEVRQRADRLIAFGRLTIAHRLVRVLILEQIYRAFRILRGQPYHRD